MATKTQTDQALIELIRADTKISSAKKMEYSSLANSFMLDFRNNILLSSIELDEKYPFGMDVWQEFLTYAVVKKYTETYRKEIMRKQVEKGMAVGDKDAISLKKELDRDAGATGYENFIIFMLPPKEAENDIYRGT